jgi:hypothetical protein
LVGAPPVVAALEAVERLASEAQPEPALLRRLWRAAVDLNGGVASVLSTDPDTAARAGLLEALEENARRSGPAD